MPPKDPYTCPSCGYKTSNKPDMYKHLYKLKKQCPKTVIDLTLTDSIKEYILENRIYHIPKKQKDPQTVIINQYNQMNNMLASMDAVDKIMSYTKQANVDVIDFADKVERKYEQQVEDLQQDTVEPDFSFNTDDLLEVINDICKISDSTYHDLNLIYDNKLRNIKMVDDGQWQSILTENGLRKIIEMLQEKLWDHYECYLVRHIMNDASMRRRQECEERLKEYYMFIGCFKAMPYAYDRSDFFLVDGTMHSHTCSEKFYPMYKGVCDAITRSQENRVRKGVLEIIKRNSNQNLSDLNRKILGMMNVDDEYKKAILKKLCVPISTDGLSD